MKNKKAFTLIELIAVLVILAILALIVTPLVLNIIRKARIAADKRSIDAYGRSIELAIADYLLDKGEFPTSIEQLTIEYTGDKVVCNHATLNEDSSVYLAECIVDGRTVAEYTYGKDNTPTYEAYSVGDEVTYNNVDYRVLANSGVKESSVTLLKSEPLTVEEVNTYGGDYVNKYTYEYRGEAYDQNGYGGVAYFSNEECTGGQYAKVSGCTNDYEKSDVKHIVDSWQESNIDSNDLKLTRLITYEDLESLDYEWITSELYGNVRARLTKTDATPGWIYNDNFNYWTMKLYENYGVDVIQSDGNLRYFFGGGNSRVYEYGSTVRPVVELYKNSNIIKK